MPTCARRCRAFPERAALRLPAGNGDCPECGAPVHFDEERLATTCGYCGADAYRAALAGAARADAQASEQRSRKSLREAVADVRSRRVELAGLVALMAFAELFYAVFFLLGSGWDYLMG